MLRSFSLYVLLFLTFVVPNCFAAEYEITVKSGDSDLRNAPVSIPLQIDGEFEPNVSIGGDEFIGIGQISKRGIAVDGEGNVALTFLLPYLPANTTMKLYGKSISADEVKHGYSFAPAEHHTELTLAKRPVWRYMREPLDKSSPKRIGETYKVFHHVYDPTGSRYVTKGPGGLFPHHRGLFFGFNRISYGDMKADIWHCKNGEHQAHVSSTMETGAVLGRETSEIDWHGRDNKVFAKETRELTSYNTENGVLIEFATTLKSQVGPVRLDGDPQHAGFQFRGSQDIPDKTKHLTYYVRPDGKGEPGKFRNWSSKKDDTAQNLAHIDLPWLALCFVLDDKRYTCCYLDHPSNPKPARFSERDYGRFGSYFEYDMDTDKPLNLNYRIWLQEGEMTVDEINQLSKSFTSQPHASITVLSK